MKRLLLVRHGKSSKDDPTLRDIERPLADRGERDAPEMGRRIAGRGPRPDRLIVSPAKRAQETARLIARELDFPWKEIRTERKVYECGPRAILEIVRGLEDACEVAMLVGHNPDMTDLARTLAPSFDEEMPTCAVLALEFAIDTWPTLQAHRGRVLWYDTPKKPAD